MTYGDPRGRRTHRAHPGTNEAPAWPEAGAGPDPGWAWTEPATTTDSRAAEIGYEPGIRRPTSDRDPTGWPAAGPGSDWAQTGPEGHWSQAGPQARRVPDNRWPAAEPASQWPASQWPASQRPASQRPDSQWPDSQWPPAPARGRDTGQGWPSDPGSEGRPPTQAPHRGWGQEQGRGQRRSGGRRAAPEPAQRGAWRGYLLVGTLLALLVGGGGAVWQSGLLNPTRARQATPAPTPTAAATSPAQRAQASPSATAPATVVDKGAGTFAPVDSEGQVLGTAGTLRRFHIEVENGINEDPAAFATIVDQVLGDPRSWIASGQLRLQHVPKAAPADFTIFLASPTTSEAMCRVGGLFTEKFTSCRLPGQVIINDARWLTAVPNYGAPLEVYRDYAVNHEVGHELGHGHEACTGPGRLAPVMQQQTLGLKGCLANSWPFVNGQRYAGPPIP